MKCNEIMENISSYLDKELDENQMKIISNHLDSCSDCRKEYEGIKEISALLLEIKDEEMEIPEGFDENLRVELKKESKKIKANFRNRRWIRYTSVAAVLLISIVTYSTYIETMNLDEIASPANIPVESFMDTKETPATKSIQAPEEFESPDDVQVENFMDTKETPAVKSIHIIEDESLINQYLNQLEEINRGATYNLLYYYEETPGVFIFEIEILNEQGNYINAIYKGQDGEIWKTE